MVVQMLDAARGEFIGKHAGLGEIGQLIGATAQPLGRRPPCYRQSPE